MLVHQLLNNKRIILITLCTLLSISTFAQRNRKLSIAIGYPHPISYFEKGVSYQKFGLGLIGINYNINDLVSIKLNNRIIGAAYPKAKIAELPNASILNRSSVLTILQIQTNIIHDGNFKAHFAVGVSNNVNENSYISGSPTFQSGYIDFGINAGPSIEYKISPLLSMGSDLLYSRQFGDKIEQPNILSASVYVAFHL